jgi:hypothetical protein
MRRLLLLPLLLLTAPIHADAGIDKATCSFRGTPLKGKVQVVEAFPDFKVQVVDAFADLHVQEVTAFPDDCGKWQVVEAFPDFKIKRVTAFPGVP